MGIWGEVVKDVTHGVMGVVGTQIVDDWRNLLDEGKDDKLGLSLEKFIKISSFDEIKRIHSGIVSRLSLNTKNKETVLLLVLHSLFVGVFLSRFGEDELLEMYAIYFG